MLFCLRLEYMIPQDVTPILLQHAGVCACMQEQDGKLNPSSHEVRRKSPRLQLHWVALGLRGQVPPC